MVSVWAWWVAVVVAAPIDLNTASAQALDALRGVGPSKAASIVAWRAEHGACVDPREVMEAPGIGKGTWLAMRGALICSDLSPPASVVAVHSPPPIRLPTVVDINRAAPAELLLLAGMSPARAALIVSDRDARGTFASCRDVTRIRGFGPATVAVWGDHCVAR